MNKRGLLFFVTLLSIPLAVADPLGQVLQNVFTSILLIASFDLLMRFLIAIIVFTLLYGVITTLGGGGSGGVPPFNYFSRAQAGILTAVITIIATIFLPAQVLLAIGSGWATLIGLILIAAPILGLAFILYQMPNDPCYWRFLKFLLSLVLLWILTAMKEHLGKIATPTAVQQSIEQFITWAIVLALLLVLYYLLSWLMCGSNQGQQVDQGKGIRKFLRNLIAPKNPTRRLGPPPPPNNPKPPRKNKGDDPNPHPLPPAVDPTYGPIPAPSYKPKQKIHIPKDKRVLIDLSPWFLSIRNQDNLGACAAFAGGSMVEYVINRVRGSLSYDYKVSELFLWYNARYDKARDVGTYPHELIRELLNGGCKETLWEFEDSSSPKYLQRPPGNTYNDAPLQRTLAVNRISNDPDLWIQALADGYPIQIGAALPQNFNGSVQAFFDNPIWPERGGHAMVIVGYDSHYPNGKTQNEAFKVRNSWGSNWAEKGYVWIPRTLLSEMLSRQGNSAFIIDGWGNASTKAKYSIKGRVIFDYPNTPIVPEPTGAELCHDLSRMAPDHNFLVGVMAQIKGKLEILQEIVVSDRSGYFYIEFETDLSSIEQPTKLSKEYPTQFSHIDFTKIPAGVVVYKKSEDPAHDPDSYFHIVDFTHSFAGRGGEGELHPDNPCSQFLESRRQFSGRPIVFSEKHHEEKNVILPVIMYSSSLKHDPKLIATVKKIETIAENEKKWAGTEFKFLEEVRQDLIAQNFERAFKHLRNAGRTQRRLSQFESKLDHELKELIQELPVVDQGSFKTIHGELLVLTGNLLKFTSRQGELNKSLDVIKRRRKVLLMAQELSPGSKKGVIEQKLQESCMALAAKIAELMQWSNGLTAKLEELEKKTKELIQP